MNTNSPSNDINAPSSNGRLDALPGLDPVSEHLKSAGFHIAQGDLRSCCSSLKRATEIAPGDVKILATLANACFQLGEFKEARTHYEQLLVFQPENAVLMVQLATVCKRLGDAEGFAAAVKRALALDPANVPARTLLAGVHLQSRQFAEAAGLYEQLVANHPNEIELLLSLAKCRFHLGDRPGARELYARVGRLEPGNPVATEAMTIIQNMAQANHCPTVLDIVQENPVLHRDKNGGPVYMSISGAVASFIHRQIKPGARTIETGAGLSTLCFLAAGARHTAIAPDAGLEPRLREYCRAHGLGDDRLTYISKTSQDVVWSLEDEFDCALIDGGHGFPIPFIDFFYLNRRLKKGGYLIIDDLEIWTGETLAKFLRCEPSWKVVTQDGNRAIVFRKVGEARATEWTSQEFVVKNSLHPHHLDTVIERDKLADASDT